MLCLMSKNSFGQNDPLLEKINSLSRVDDIPLDSCLLWDKDCGDAIIWEIVKYGKEAIEPLIDKITDTSNSNYYFRDVYAYRGPIKLRTGDIAYIVLEQIFYFQDIPMRGVFDVKICGGYPADLFNYYLFDFSYRLAFEKAIREEYHRKKLKWIICPKKELTPCEIQYGILGHYRE